MKTVAKSVQRYVYCILMQLETCSPSQHGHVVSRSVVVQQALDGASAGNHNVLVPQGHVGPGLDVGSRHSVYSIQSLADGCSVASQQHLRGNVVDNGHWRVQSSQQGGLDSSLGTSNLGVGDRHRQTVPLLQSEVHKVVNSLKVGDLGVETPQTGVGVRGGEVRVLVDNVVVSDDGGQLWRRVLGSSGVVVKQTKHGGCNLGHVVSRRRHSLTLCSNGHVRLWVGVVAHSDLGTQEGGWLSHRLEASGHLQLLLQSVNQGIVVKVTGGGNNGVGGHHSLFQEASGVLQLQVGDGLGRTEQGQAQRVASERRRIQVLQDHARRRGLQGTGLGDSGVFGSGKVCLFKLGAAVAHSLSHGSGSGSHVAVGGLRNDTRGFSGSVRRKKRAVVKPSAQNGSGQGGYTIVVGVFGARTGTKENTHGGGRSVGVDFRGHSDAIGQSCELCGGVGSADKTAESTKHGKKSGSGKRD
ncbi:hypothetical protein EJF18_10653 [Clavispora lusitaniae]|uniref:Uncharacterized protein n=1 Tax=Clavispora lusitaniae TaxID=36911 RepID=A0ACD0WE70_CLALS|nr:hypothetical protein EJF14_10653 [Clavispora lusitaniae]QFZ31142.1 hypothetical protein EJF16_10653 [Clavispora lusitaniae]QFZ36810.1 hypothetical protein EJF15_10653 [Clavispora lusitaniae]QFZ42494.1 hypothetical protein EJF18_10653 [Clavispora lusitaniae]QFZ48170.1 hypothetical protein EJF17_10653 [Clavispora lusitaniae]